MMIKTSLDWSSLESNLLHKSMGLQYGREVRLMIRNIQNQVDRLSRAEVEARRGRRYQAVEILEQINHDIELVEEYLLVAALIG